MGCSNMVFLIVFLLAMYLIFGTKKGRKIASKVAAKILKSSFKIVIYIALIALVVFMVVKILEWMFENFLLSVVIVVVAVAGMIALGYYQENKEKQQLAEMVTRWKSKPVNYMELLQVENFIRAYIGKTESADTNKTKFISDFPYGRISYFLNFFQKDLSNEEPLYFSPLRSKDSNELREYGTVITSTGIYISHQTDKTDKNGAYVVKDFPIKFSGIVSSKLSGDTLSVYYEKYEDKVEVDQKHTTVPLQVLNEICQAIVSSGVSGSFYNNYVFDYADYLNQKEDEFIAQNTAQGYAAGFEAAGIASSLPQMGKVFAEVGNTMNKRQGHGDAAEYANTAYDRFTGDFRAQHMGADNALNGADRSTHRIFRDETLIQCKYRETYPSDIKNPSAKSNTIINDAFVDHDYPLDMKVEVPRDAYSDCVRDLQQRIDSGEFEHKGIKPGDRAENYLKRGIFSLAEAHNIAVAGRIEGIAVDAMQGIVCSAGAGSITAIITFATCKWQGMETKDAALQALASGAKVIGKSTAVFVITMQLSRKNMVNNIWGMIAKNKGNPQTTINPVFKISENLATKISKSSLANTGLGQKLGLNKTTGKALISGTVAVAVTFGPDIVRSLTGRISFKQLIKNSAVGGAGFAGAAIGQTIIPIPVVGGMIGGAVAGFVAKKTLDHFIEDDAIEMFAILKEEFIDIVPMTGLNSDEFNQVVEMTIAHKKLPSLLRDMYAFGDSRGYARDHIVNIAVQHVLGQREMITDDMYCDGIGQLAAE